LAVIGFYLDSHTCHFKIQELAASKKLGSISTQLKD
jgi:hypothetical protein